MAVALIFLVHLPRIHQLEYRQETANRLIHFLSTRHQHQHRLDSLLVPVVLAEAFKVEFYVHEFH